MNPQILGFNTLKKYPKFKKGSMLATMFKR